MWALTMQRTLDRQAEMFIDSDIASVTTHNLCEWMDIESDINVKTGIVQDAMAEVGKCFK